MADFPNNPALNQLYTSGWSTWMWDGVKWMASMPSGGVYEPVFGGTQYPMYGFLYNKTVGDPGYSAWAGFGAHRWRFGTNPGDEQDAGAIDYRGYVSDALSIVGAGTVAGSRKINLYDNVNVAGNLTVGTTTILGGGGGIFSVGQITATGPLAISGPVGTTGSSAILTFQDRTGTTNWGWYAQAGVARLWNDQSGDRFTVDSGGTINTPGSVRAAGNIYLGGSYLLFSGATAGGPFIYGDATDIAAQLGTLNGAFKWYSNPGAQLMRLDNGGTLSIAQSFSPGFNVGAGDVAIELGLNRTGSGNSYIDFHANPSVDFDFRIIRNPGPNGGVQIVNNGTGAVAFQGQSFTFDHDISTPGSVHVTGPAATYYFQDQGTANYFAWYATGNVARLWYNTTGDRLSVATDGTVTTAGNLFVNASIRVLGGGDWGGTTNGGSFTSRVLRFQIDPGDEGNAGYIGYRGIGDAGALDIIGAGTSANRWVRVWDHLKVSNFCEIEGSLNVIGGQVALYNSNNNGFYVQNAGGDYLRIFDDGNPHIEGSGNQLWIQSNGAGTYFGGPINVWDLYSRQNINCAGDHYQGGHYHFFNGQAGNVNSTGGPFIYADGSWMILHLGAGNTGYQFQATGGNTIFQMDGAGNTTIFGALGLNGNITCQGSIYTNHVVMNNACLLYGRDTAGTQQWLITMWSDNVIYVGDGSHDLHLRGYTTYCDNSNEFRCNNAIHAVGSNAMLYFDDRTDGIVWGWYAHNSVVHLYSNLDGDRVAIDRGGNISTGGIFTAWDVHANSGLFCNGLLWQNNGGWWWTGSPIHSDSEMTCSALNFGGCRLANVSGYAYFDQTTHAAGHYSRGDIWCAGSMTSGNHLQANGGGWCIEAPNGGIYCPNEVHGGYVTSGGNVYAGNDITANSVFRGTGNGGARIGNWQGSGWDWMAFAIISGGYLGVSPDQGASGFNYTPNASWSDARLKLNIRASEIDALAVIGAIPVRAFDWTEKGRELMPRDVSSVSCGLVAQELEELIPDAVTLVPVIGDLAGDPMRCIIHEQLDAYYIRAFQQLAARVEELEDLVRNQRSLT